MSPGFNTDQLIALMTSVEIALVVASGITGVTGLLWAGVIRMGAGMSDDPNRSVRCGEVLVSVLLPVCSLVSAIAAAILAGRVSGWIIGSSVIAAIALLIVRSAWHDYGH
jgi:hypothetical protein